MNSYLLTTVIFVEQKKGNFITVCGLGFYLNDKNDFVSTGGLGTFWLFWDIFPMHRILRSSSHRLSSRNSAFTFRNEDKKIPLYK